MPELPEVETVRRSLADKVTGQQICSVQVLSQRAIRPVDSDTFAVGLVGKRVLRLGRRGKYLRFDFHGGGALIVHLRMTGRLVIVSPQEPLPKHTAVVICFDSGQQLRFIDQRKFGLMELIENEEEASEGYRTLGLEPLDPDFTPAYLAGVLQNRTARIKGLLLNQGLIAGLGNIYADEALFRAGIHPERIGKSLAEAEIVRLHRAIQEVIAAGIAHRGTTIRDYVDGYGEAGTYQERLQVYGKEGQPCPQCLSPLQRVKVAGRSSFHCPHCQR